ncbi:MAG: FG-GAP-like repeat-containing protein [Bacteroidota bacterium]|nr:FG-GAP-like repeat-containing protein [Bacteroidota bacterium]
MFESVSIGDLNNDCLNDVVFLTNLDSDSKPSVQIWLQGSDGKLKFNTKIVRNGYLAYNKVKTKDVNNDHLTDIIFSDNNVLVVLYQDVSGGFNKSQKFNCSCYNIDDFDIGDLNNDSIPDIVYFGYFNKSDTVNLFRILFQNTLNNFTSKDIWDNQQGYDQIKIGDINNDCLNDIIGVGSAPHKGIISVIYGGEMSIKKTFVNYSNSFTRFNGFDIGRVGFDNKNSLIITTGINESVNYKIQQTQNNTLDSIPIIFGKDEVPIQVKIADLNNDGINEIVVGNYSWKELAIYSEQYPNKNQFNRFKLKAGYGDNNNTSMDIGDLNNDGLPDIVYINEGSKFEVHYNTLNLNRPKVNDIKVTFNNCDTIKEALKKEEKSYTLTFNNASSGCNVSKVNQYKITETYLKRTGIGDSVKLVSFCEKENQIIKKNQIVTQTFYLRSDTAFDKLIERKVFSTSSKIKIDGSAEVCTDVENRYDVLNSEPIKYSYVWHTGLSDSTTTNELKYIFSKNGIETISVKGYIKNDTVYCEKRDSLKITINPNPSQQEIIGRDTVCIGEYNQEYSFNKYEPTSIYTWSVTGVDIGITSATNVYLNFNQEGQSTIQLIEKNEYGCSNFVGLKNVFAKGINDCVKFPNVFTPNNDGVNETFIFSKIPLVLNNELKVYNRWGMLVYDITNYSGEWNASNLPDGIYYYLFTVNNRKINGWVEVLR